MVKVSISSSATRIVKCMQRSGLLMYDRSSSLAMGDLAKATKTLEVGSIKGGLHVKLVVKFALINLTGDRANRGCRL